MSVIKCPFCGKELEGKIGGGIAAFGCGEFYYELECSCGFWDLVDLFDSEEEAVREGERFFREKYSSEKVPVMGEDGFLSCPCGNGDILNNVFCEYEKGQVPTPFRVGFECSKCDVSMDGDWCADKDSALASFKRAWNTRC